jgi:methyltransferase (TIGR00027 family)
MRRRASSTSQAVTIARALANAGFTEVREFSDPTAMPMLSRRARLVVRLLLGHLVSRPAVQTRLFERSSSGRLDLIALRTRALDEAWHEAHAGGARQLVILGAGLDGRAFRLDDVADSSVFDVDHPATQARAGLRCIDDTGEREWRARFSTAPQRTGEVGERIAVGER